MSNDSSRQIGEYSGKHRTLEARAGIRNGVKRLIFVLISILLEIILFIVAFVGLHQYAGWLLIITRFAATILILMICSQDRTASIKMFWIIVRLARKLHPMRYKSLAFWDFYIFRLSIGWG